jgi:CheY-like chemotaxis protein
METLRNNYQRSKGNIKILVAEDNVLNQRLLGFMLNTWGFKCDLCANGTQALEKLKHARYDLILMDIEMPEMDGYETTQFIRQDLKLDIPIIAVTAHASDEEKEKSLRSGMSEYISKPIKGDELRALLTAYLFPSLVTQEHK